MQPMESRSYGISVAGYLGGVVLGSMALTLVFLGMRSVMDVGGACADGGPYLSSQSCPAGSTLALVGGIFALFGAAGLMIWFGTRLGGRYVALVALGWPAMFISLGANFLQYGIDPPGDGAGPIWGWLIPGILFWIVGGVPLLVGIAGWRGSRSTNPTTLFRTSTRADQSTRIEFAPNWSGAPRPAPASDGADPADSADAALDGIDEDLVSRLERLASLHASGALTEEEFAAAKGRLLAHQRLDP